MDDSKYINVTVYVTAMCTIDLFIKMIKFHINVLLAMVMAVRRVFD